MHCRLLKNQFFLRNQWKWLKISMMFELWLKTNVDPVEGPVDNHWGKEKDELQTTQSHSLSQCSHPQPEVDHTEQLTLLLEIYTSHFSNWLFRVIRKMTQWNKQTHLWQMCLLLWTMIFYQLKGFFMPSVSLCYIPIHVYLGLCYIWNILIYQLMFNMAGDHIIII